MESEYRQAPAAKGKALLLLGGLGLGALIMYLGDPQAGRRRRARIRDQYAHAARKVQEGADVVLRDASHRASGLAASARTWMGHLGEATDDAVLVERVRAALGRATSHPRVIDVEADQGHVTLKGMALAEEARAIVECARKVRGVKAVDNRLSVHQTAEGIPALQGRTGRNGARWELLQENWSPAWRSLAGAIGAGLTVAGWLRGGAQGLGIGALGAGLVARAATNRDLKSLAGTRGAGKGVVVQKTIHVDAPVEEVYGHWRVENFPQWMSHVREVKPLGGNRHHWVVEGPAKVPVEWDAEISEQVENRGMAWHSLADSVVDNAGRVRFEPEDGGTRVHVTFCYIPPGGVLGHAVARALGGDPRSRMDDDLMRFKMRIETGQPSHDAAARKRGMGWLSSFVRH